MLPLLRLGRRLIALSFVAASFICAQSTSFLTTVSIENLHHAFRNPPISARPMVRWWWFGLAVQKSEILRELQQMKADGIGGAELAFEYPQVLDDPSKGLKNLPFLSPEFLDDVNYAQSEGRKLGLRIDVTVGSGWPYGGPATTLAEAAGRLRIAEVPLPANATSIATPKLAEGETLISLSLVNGEPNKWDAASSRSLNPAVNNRIPPEPHPRTVRAARTGPSPAAGEGRLGQREQ